LISKSPGFATEMSPPRPARDPRRAYDRGVWTDTGEEAPAETDLARLSTDEIVAELRRREGRLSKLIEKRRSLAEELAELEREIRSIEDTPSTAGSAPRSAPHSAPRGRPGQVRHALPRPRNSLSLADAMAAEVETGETVGPGDLAKRVLRNGYQTTAKNFTLLVNGTLRKDPRFERVGRGAYRRLGTSAVPSVDD
jgi:hypothetical protein